jgi:hypothetical protein
VSGEGPKTATLALTIDSEEITELTACGGGATSVMQGPVLEFEPGLAVKLVGGGG